MALARAIIIKLMTIYDRIGDCIYCVVDEVKFWGEVLASVMEWDEESQAKWAEGQFEKMRDSINRDNGGQGTEMRCTKRD